MQKGSKILNILYSAAIFILMEIAALYMLNNKGEMQRVWFSEISHGFMAKVWGVGESVGNFFSLRSHNERLSLELFYLNEEVGRYRAAEQQRLSAAKTDLLSDASNGFRYTPASIVKMSRNKQHNYFIIDKGVEDGITPRSGVITARGAIGIVDAVEEHYSYCLSLLNESLSVSARLGRNGIVGPLSWNGKGLHEAVLKEIPLQNKYSPGDTVWTSGFSALFPPDIPLGVAGKARVINGSVNEIEVRLFEDFNSLRHVTVTESNGRNEIITLEQMEGGI